MAWAWAPALWRAVCTVRGLLLLSSAVNAKPNVAYQYQKSTAIHWKLEDEGEIFKPEMKI